MATPSKPTVYVAPATEDDYDQLVEWNCTILERNDPTMSYVFAYPERAAEDVLQIRHAFTDRSTITFKAVLTEGNGKSDRVVGYVHIVVRGENWIEEQDAEGAGKGQQPPPNRVDPKAFDQLVGETKRTRRQFMGGKPHILVRQLCVDPAHQRVGAGTALMQYVIQLASDAKIPIHLETTQKGRGLYDRLGFEVVGELHLDLPDGTTVSLSAMTRAHKV